MFERTKFVHNSFSVVFPRQQQIRRLANEFEDRLKGKYFQPQIISVPDDLDPEVPRMIFGSEHGFSQIVVSQVSIAINVAYSPDWQLEISKGQNYLLEQVPLLFELLDVLDGVKPYFCGLNTQVNIPSTAEDETIIRQLSKVFLKDQVLEAVHDIQLKTTTIVSEQFFNNITLQNYRVWRTNGSQQGVPRFSLRDVLERGVQITGDFNDRYAFNEREGYTSNQEVAAQVIENGLAEVRSVIERLRGKFRDTRD